MHVLSILAVLGILAMSLGVIGTMLSSNSARIMCALRGGETRERRSVAGYPRIPARRALSPRIVANDLRTRVALAA